MGTDGGKNEGTPMINDLTSFKNFSFVLQSNNPSISTSLTETFDFSDVKKKQKEKILG